MAKNGQNIINTRLTALCLRLPGWDDTRKVTPIWILLKQETVGGSGISWAICKSAPRPRQIPVPAPTTQFLQAGCPSCHPTNSVKALKAKNWKKTNTNLEKPKPTVNFKICSHLCVCVYHCAQLSYTTQHRTVLIIMVSWSQLSQIGCLPYFHTWCGLSANLRCRSKTCCTWLAENTGRKKVAKKSPSGHHRTTLLGYTFTTKAHINNRKKPVKHQYVLHMS